MDGLQSFLSPGSPSLKICGITTADDAAKLVTAQVPALGVNFWSKSKRYCTPESALTFLPPLANKIVRVGVFVNNAKTLAPGLLENNALDAVQLHGDENEEELDILLCRGIPTIRSLALKQNDDLGAIARHYQTLATRTSGTLALLLDAHAPGLYGGTGETIDWKQAAEFIQLASPLPVLLAGGIVPGNAMEAVQTTRPAGLDVASGAESSPGVKDHSKVAKLLTATPARPTS